MLYLLMFCQSLDNLKKKKEKKKGDKRGKKKKKKPHHPKPLKYFDKMMVNLSEYTFLGPENDSIAMYASKRLIQKG